MTKPHKKLVGMDKAEFASATRSLLKSIAVQDKWKKPAKSRYRLLRVKDSEGDAVWVHGKFSIVDATLLFGLAYFDFEIPKATNFLTRFFAFVDLAEADGVEWDRFGDEDETMVDLPKDTLNMAATMHPESLQDFMVEDIHKRARRLKGKYGRVFRRSPP